MTGQAPGETLRPLPLLMRPALRAVFIGYNPGIESARRGHYYAFPGNVFWKQLKESGLVSRPVGPEDDRLLMDEAGIGFTDLCRRPSVRAGELTEAEIAEGALRLRAELAEFAPRVAVFSGKGIFAHYERHALGRRPAASNTVLYGQQHGAWPVPGSTATAAWVIPSSSGLASRWHRDRLAILRNLAAELRREG